MLILYGEKPKQCLDKKRLNMASTLLKNSDKPVSQISSSCGYASISWFIIQFKKLYMVTPLHFKCLILIRYLQVKLASLE